MGQVPLWAHKQTTCYLDGINNMWRIVLIDSQSTETCFSTPEDLSNYLREAKSGNPGNPESICSALVREHQSREKAVRQERVRDLFLKGERPHAADVSCPIPRPVPHPVSWPPRGVWESYRCPWTKHVFYSSLGHATLQHKLCSSPWCCVSEIKLPMRLLVWRSVFVHRHRYVPCLPTRLKQRAAGLVSVDVLALDSTGWIDSWASLRGEPLV